MARPARADQDDGADRYRHTEIDGSKVVRDEVLLSSLSTKDRPVPLHGTRVLTLEDGRLVYACRDCAFLGARSAMQGGKKVFSTRGDIRKHRYDKHATVKAVRRRRGAAQEEELPLDDVDQVGLPYPNEHVRGMQIGELLEFAEHVDQWGRVLDAANQKVEHWKERALVAEKRIRQIKRTLGNLLPAEEGVASHDG